MSNGQGSDGAFAVGVIVAAAGSSRRYGESGGLRPKLDEDLGGKPVLQRSVELFTRHDDVAAIVVAGPGEDADFAEFRARHADRLGLLGATLVRGGRTHRWESVQAALAAMPLEAGGRRITHIAVHDAARPGTPPELLDRVFEAARRHGAAIPALEVGDTLKRFEEVEGDESEGDPLAAILGVRQGGGKRRVVGATVDRAGLVAVQTPQVFEAALLREAYAQKDLSSTDDAGLVERVLSREGKGRRIALVTGDVRNMKITWSGDLSAVRAMMGLKSSDERPVHKRF